MSLREIDILEIEAHLGAALPEEIRQCYLVGNGVRGPTDCNLLHSYGIDPLNDIVRANTIKEEAWYPATLLSLFIVGDDGCGNLICFDSRSNEAVLWNPAEGDWIQERRSRFSELWSDIKRRYDTA